MRIMDAQIFNAVTTGTSSAYNLSNAEKIRVFAEWSTGVTAGVVTVECAGSANFGGTWKSLGTLTFTANSADSIYIDGPVRFLRVRISTTVTGGTVSVYLSAVGGS